MASLLKCATDSGQSSETAAPRVWESEIRSQAELADLVSFASPRRLGPDEIALARMLWSILGELEMIEWTGTLPGGLPWNRQVWWRVELWRAFWRERDRMLIRESEEP